MHERDESLGQLSRSSTLVGETDSHGSPLPESRSRDSQNLASEALPHTPPSQTPDPPPTSVAAFARQCESSFGLHHHSTSPTDSCVDEGSPGFLPCPKSSIEDGQNGNDTALGHGQASRRPSTPVTDRQLEEARVLKYDRGRGMQIVCIVGSFMGAIFALGFLIAGIYVLTTSQPQQTLSYDVSEPAYWAISYSVHLTFLCSAYSARAIRDVSLRWGLSKDGRLGCNTHIAPFASSTRSKVHKWYMGIVFNISLSLASACTLTSFRLPSLKPDGKVRYAGLNGMVMVLCGLAAGITVIITSWTLATTMIPTWSSNPLNTASAAVQKGLVTPRPNRCMLSVQQQHEADERTPDMSTYVYPRDTQPSLVQAYRSTRYLLMASWALPMAAIIGAVTVLVLCSQGFMSYAAIGQGLTFSWEKNTRPRNFAQLVVLPKADGSSPYKFSSRAVCGVLFLASLHLIQTLSLDCAEGVLHRWTDELTWRRAYAEDAQFSSGALLSQRFLAATILSPYKILFLMNRATLHWALGQCVLVTSRPRRNDLAQMEFYYVRLGVYALLACSICGFVTFLATRHPRGPQPATFGHLQTLADVVDDWETDEKNRLWWGDKTQVQTTASASASVSEESERRAGTSSRREGVSRIRKSERYL